MRRTVRSGATFLVLAAVLTGAFLLLRRDPPPAPEFPPASPASSVVGDADQPAPSGAIGRVAVVPFVEPESRPADSRPSDSRPAPESLPTTGVRGRITSPRVRLNPASDPEPVFGVDPQRCAVYVSRIRMDRRGAVAVAPYSTVRPAGSRGDFVAAVPPGLWLVAARQDDLPAVVVEFWFAVIRVADGDLVDLGANRFTETQTKGRLIDDAGAAIPGALIVLDAGQDCALDGMNAHVGAVVALFSGSDGRCACAISRYEGERSAIAAGPLLEVTWGVPSENRPETAVLVGSTTTLVVRKNRDANQDRSVPFVVEHGDGGRCVVRGADRAYVIPPAEPGELSSEFSLLLEPGAYVVECWNASLFDRTVVQVGPPVAGEAPIRVDPSWKVGRTVVGRTRGRVSRLIERGGSLDPIEAQSVDADGDFELSGLPFEAFELRVGERRLRIAGGSDLRVVLSE